jgi:hypothetical protein
MNRANALPNPPTYRDRLGRKKTKPYAIHKRRPAGTKLLRRFRDLVETK